jgi:hypothetical protein
MLWSRPSILNSSPSGISRVNALVTHIISDHETTRIGGEHAVTRKDIAASHDEKIIVSPGFARDVYTDLVMQLQQPDHLALKDTIMSFKEANVTDYMLVLDTVMQSGCGVFIKHMLGYVLHIPHDPIFKWLEEPFRDKYLDWASIRLCCDPGSAPTPEHRTFVKFISKIVIKNKSAKFDQINILKDIYNPLRMHTLYMRDPPTISDSMIVSDANLLQEYKVLGNRLASLLGHQRVTPTIAVPNSFASAVDSLSAFLKAGEALAGLDLSNHRSRGADFLKGIISEQARRYTVFARSLSPTATFPSPFVAADSPSVAIKDQMLSSLHYQMQAAKHNPDLLRISDMVKTLEDLQRRGGILPEKAKADGSPKPDAAKTGKRKPPAAKEKNPPSKRGKADHSGEYVIGAEVPKLSITDNAQEIGVGTQKILKAKFAAICGCGTEDKCWAVCFSNVPWPRKLEFSNRKDEPGHESDTSSHHTFTAVQMLKCRRLVFETRSRP